MVRRNLGMVLVWLLATMSTGALAWGVVQLAAAQAANGPVRPLTAAEVSALPVSTASPEASIVAFPAEPTQSDQGALESSTTTSTIAAATTTVTVGPTGVAAGAEASTTRPTTTATTTTATLTTAATSATSPATTTTSATAPPAAPAAPEIRTFELVGGSAQVELGPNTLRLIWARPNSGFSMEDEVGDQELEVNFEAGHHTSELKIERSDDDWDIEIKEEPEEEDHEPETNSTEPEDD